MRVVEFTDTFLPIMDGVGNVVYQYALNIAEKGHDCSVAAPATDSTRQGGHPFRDLDYRNIPFLGMKSYQIGMPGTDRGFHARLEALEVDLVHVHTPFMAGRQGAKYAKKHGLPLVGTFHSRYYEDFLQVTHLRPLARLGAKIVARFYNRCDEVWTPSASAGRDLRRYGYRGPLRIMVNGTDVRKADPADIASVSESYGLGEKPVLLYVGQINWKKNLRRVLEAAAKLEGDFRLVLAGQGPHERDIRRLADKLGLRDKLVLTGHIGEPQTLAALYARASLFVFPSLYDTAGLVVRDSGAAEGIRHGENGFLCEDDAGDLARIITGALRDPEGTARVGEEARRTIPIPWTDLLDDVLERYAALVHGKQTTENK